MLTEFNNRYDKIAIRITLLIGWNMTNHLNIVITNNENEASDFKTAILDTILNNDIQMHHNAYKTLRTQIPFYFKNEENIALYANALHDVALNMFKHMGQKNDNDNAEEREQYKDQNDEHKRKFNCLLHLPLLYIKEKLDPNALFTEETWITQPYHFTHYYMNDIILILFVLNQTDLVLNQLMIAHYEFLRNKYKEIDNIRINEFIQKLNSKKLVVSFAAHYLLTQTKFVSDTIKMLEQNNGQAIEDEELSNHLLMHFSVSYINSLILVSHNKKHGTIIPETII